MLESTSPSGDGVPGFVAGTKDLLNAECDYIRPWTEKTGHGCDKLAGLALSGGGIRSASFALGVMQALAAEDLLKKFDYLSTVSGGGYIGSSVVWFAQTGRFGVSKNDFPYGVDDPDGIPDKGFNGQKLLQFLRGHGNYLTPGKGITIWSGIAVVLRGMLINLLVWLPLLVAAFVLLRLGKESGPILPFDWAGPLGAVPPAFQIAVLIAVVLVLLFFGFAIAYSLLTYWDAPWLAGEATRYRLRRFGESIAGRAIFLVVALALFGTLPIAGDFIADWAQRAAIKAGGPIALILSGLGSGLWVFLRGDGAKGGIRLPTAVIAVIGAMLLIYGASLLAYWLAGEIDGRWSWWFGLLAWSAIFGWFVDINLISLHRFYRDRLMETFLPDLQKALDNETGWAVEANRLNIQQIWNPAAPLTPFPIINTNAVLVDSLNERFRVRGGDSFALTPLYCGSNATGWKRTKEFVGGFMSLPTAMAISGAAVNPNTAAYGLTRNPFVALLMNLLNVRLGYWVENPNDKKRTVRYTLPNHFIPGLCEVGGAAKLGYREDRSFVQLSDGGHFENLGIYELIRRRARVIVVSDGTADPTYSFADLRRALRLIKEDFGVTVDFGSDVSKLEPLMPQVDPNCNYPLGIRISKQGYIVGGIIYPDKKWKGTLIFLTTTIVPKLGLPTMGYKGDNPLFPDQSTVDQFFDEDQFEAYRELGYRIAEGMIADSSVSLSRHLA